MIDNLKKINKFVFYVVFALMQIPAILLPQENQAVFDHLTVEDGLSNSLVFEMTQDSLGFIWIATQDGLNRYDGYTFKVFRGDDSVKTVVDNWIACITTDREGNIWYGTRTAGIGKIDVKSGKFISFKERLLTEFGESALNVQNLFITEEGDILIATWGSGLLIYNIAGSSFKQYIHDENDPASISENRIYSVYKDSKGNIWAGAQRTGLNKLNKETGKFEHFHFTGKDPGAISNNFVLTIVEDWTGDIWVGTYSNGLFKIDRNTDKVQVYGSEYKMTGKRISKIFEDSNKNLWIGTNGEGIFRYKRQEGEFINLRNDPSNTRSLNRDKVWSVMEDRNGLLWFGTLTNGINIYDKSKNQFNTLVHREDDPGSIISSYVKAIHEDNRGNLWLGTPEGTSIVSPDGSVNHLTEASGLSVNNSRVFHQRKNGEIWIGAWGGGINIYDPLTGKFRYLQNDPENSNSLADNFLKCIEEKDNVIYIGTERGMNQYFPSSGKFKLFVPLKGDTTSISHAQITSIFTDSKENIWVGTNSGLNIFDEVRGTFKRLHIKDSDIIPQRKRIRDIFEDSRGNIWIGTLGAGLARFIPDKNDFEFITQKDGLSNNSIYEILEDNRGFLWISTNIGLNRYDPVNNRFKVYRAADGLPNDEFNSGAAYKDNNGTIYFGGVEGLTYFDPESLSQASGEPEISITRITINGEDYNPHGFYSSVNNIELPYNRNFINISFTTLDFSDPESQQFKYKLDGINDNWIYNEEGNTAVFTNLDHGDYTFKVMGTNKDGIWSKEARLLTITINPPWWDTITARVIYVLFFKLVVLSIYKLRIRQISERKKLLEKIVNERTRDLRESKKLLEEAIAAKDKLFSIIAHDLKNPFVALLGYSEMLTNDQASLSESERIESTRYIYDASRSVYSLLQNLLDWARLQLNTIDCSPVDLEAKRLLDDVLSIYTTSASIKSVNLVNNIPKGLIISADENMSHTIFRNIISNSIKFTNTGGSVTVSSETTEETIRIVIEDDGVGMNSETLNRLKTNTGFQISKHGTSKEKGTGLGLMLVKEFVQKNNGKIELSSSSGKGTKIAVELPRSKN